MHFQVETGPFVVPEGRKGWPGLPVSSKTGMDETLTCYSFPDSN
ncbi:hypothetical protein [Labrenzia sp. 011]|nr:hypothetical protein [Labrenzia sp. 011]